MNRQAIPNFSTFAIEGKEIFNTVTGTIKKLKTGTNKYQLFDDNKKSHTLTFEQIKALVSPAKTKATATADKPKTTKPAAAKEGDKKMKKHEQCYRLHLKGKTTEQIMEIVRTPKGATLRNIWLYTTGKKTLDA